MQDSALRVSMTSILCCHFKGRKLTSHNRKSSLVSVEFHLQKGTQCCYDKLKLGMATRTCFLKPLDNNQLIGLALTKSTDTEGVEIAGIGHCLVTGYSPGIGDKILSVNNINVQSFGVLCVLRVILSETKKGDIKLVTARPKRQTRAYRRSYTTRYSRASELSIMSNEVQQQVNQRHLTVHLSPKDFLIQSSVQKRNIHMDAFGKWEEVSLQPDRHSQISSYLRQSRLSSGIKISRR
ncbi:hypothetical protein ACOME3_003372 [Neoechinorhynchus agilis]